MYSSAGDFNIAAAVDSLETYLLLVCHASQVLAVWTRVHHICPARAQVGVLQLAGDQSVFEAEACVQRQEESIKISVFRDSSVLRPSGIFFK
jgi:hypothetical protein